MLMTILVIEEARKQQFKKEDLKEAFFTLVVFKLKLRLIMVN